MENMKANSGGRSAYGYQRKKEIDTTALWGQLAELEVWGIARRSFCSSIPGNCPQLILNVY
ncbi:hypothetical protein PJF56_08880 [Roseofilum sp. BLCC_M91]|uniref:Uncharacterized protein n=1 Tax=Roseofilum halophilum BLCC-M91 TaxID=3022259 RepID=A0ABT7BIG4_9CYAN|nr:hypothetical protein [Roseofilum halophilum]MDJ1178976.1 hypothetical protein [Roseofilum halophilum BLCC-M91]